MEALSFLFHEVLYRPLLNALMAIYFFMPIKDFGVAIILLTVLTRVIFLPLSLRAARSQQLLAKLQPKIKEINEKNKNNKELAMREIMALYREHKVNPVGGCVPILLQLPILIALYRVFLDGLDAKSLSSLYWFLPHVQEINTMFAGILDITKPHPVLAVLAGASQFILSKEMMKTQQSGAGGKNEFAKAMSWQMTYFFPIFTVFLAWTFPAGLVLYWIATTIFSLLQQYYIDRAKNSGNDSGARSHAEPLAK